MGPADNVRGVDLRRVDLNLLVALDAVLAERNVTRAAERLSIGQSAMSSTLGRLRRLFGDPLLVREGRGLTPTPLGLSLEQPVREALDHLREVLVLGTEFHPATDARAFTIAASDYVVLTFLHPLLADLNRVAPHVGLYVKPTLPDFEIALRRRDLDLLIVPQTMFDTYSRHGHALLFEDDWVCAVASDNPEVGSTITLDQLQTLPYIATTSGSYPSAVERQLDVMGIPRRTEISVGLAIAPRLLPGTGLVTFLPRRLATLVADDVRIRIVPAPLELAPLRQMLVWPRALDADPAHRWVKTYLLSRETMPSTDLH